MTLPTTVTYGYITARVLLAVADTTADPDRYPDGVAPNGAKITFTPVQNILATTPPDPTLVLKQEIECTINETGEMIDPTGTAGVCLVTGQYRVKITQAGATPPDPFTIELTTAHTAVSPMNLTLHMPATTPPTPIPVWQLLTATEYAALPAPAPGTLYLIG